MKHFVVSLYSQVFLGNAIAKFNYQLATHFLNALLIFLNVI